MFGRWLDPDDRSLSGGKLLVSSWISPTHSSQAISESMMMLMLILFVFDVFNGTRV